MSTLIILYESSIGYNLFEVKEWEEIQNNTKEFLESVNDYKVLKGAVSLLAKYNFKNAKEALENIKGVSNGDATPELLEFLRNNLPISKKKSTSQFVLGVGDKQLAKNIKEELNVNCEIGSFITEIFRVLRTFLHKFHKIAEEDVSKAQLGLAHQYSRMKCMFDVNRDDKPIIQSIALVDQLDKNVNSFCMRIKEWFGWHFPELSKIVTDNATFVRVVSLIENKENVIENYNNQESDLKEKLIEIVLEPEIADRIFEAARSSMGSELSEIDAINIRAFCQKLNGMYNYRQGLGSYLKDKMKMLAPNTSNLVGEILGARLISHSGSLSNLCKYPASTIQILGAEKALFRALKARSGKTPKYGLLYYSNFIGKSLPKNKGKISRFLANKLAQSSRLDFFSTNRDGLYGEEFKKQVEERMNFIATGEKPRKNVECMKEVSEQLALQEKKKEKSKNKEEKKEKPKKKEVEDSSESEAMLKKKRKNSTK